MTIVRTEEEILEWIIEKQDYYYKILDDHDNENNPFYDKKNNPFYNKMLGGYDSLNWIFKFLTEKDDMKIVSND